MVKSKSKIPDHKHCPVCGRVIGVNDEYCSSKCEEFDLKRRRQIARLRLMFYVSTGIMLFLLLVVPLLLSR